MSTKITSMHAALDELRKRDDLEKLRRFLIMEQCFPTQKNPETSAITMEELKKLARAWKLNERRNFWKTHSDRNEMVAVLLQHAEDNQSFGTRVKKTPLITTRDDSKPVPPKDSRPSATKTRPGVVSLEMKNYYGVKVMWYFFCLR